jgi:AcrR family transcriptional regulator
MANNSPHTNGNGAAPRRMSPDDRRAQLQRVALEVAAERGPAGLSLDEVAERAGVTRNLLYHYFPRGRPDLILAAVDQSGNDLSANWVTDPAIPHAERLAMNFGRIIEHAAEPTPAWVAMRHSRISADPEVQKRADVYRNLVIDGMTLNNFGTTDPPPLAKLAIRAFLAYAEEALDESREQGIDSNAVLALLAQTLTATADAAIELTAPGVSEPAH